MWDLSHLMSLKETYVNIYIYIYIYIYIACELSPLNMIKKNVGRKNKTRMII